MMTFRGAEWSFLLLLLVFDRPPWTDASAAVTSAAASAVCPLKCECKWKGGKESVTCHNIGLTDIPAVLEPTVQVLDLGGNPLAQLGAQAFRRLGLLHLQRILLQRCSIRSVERSTFMGLTNLVELDLSHNALAAIPVHAFDAVPQLRELKLSGNPLIRLNNHALAAVSQLVRLELANCQLNVVEPKAFQGLELLEWLRLDGNLIESLPSSSLSFLSSLRGLDLHHNPWHCTCALRPIRSWLAARNMPFSIPPLCLSPSRLRGQSWNRIDSDELACPPVVGVTDQLVQVQTGQSATMSCQVNANPEASVAWFFADRLIANLSVSSDAATATDASVDSERFQQLYYISETGTVDKTSHLKLSSAREQDSGVYVCRAWNKGGRSAGNVTLLVRSGSPTDSPTIAGRGLTAGLLLAGFVTLAIGLLACCCCCLRRARSPTSTFRRRLAEASSASNLTATGQYQKCDMVDNLLPSSRDGPFDDAAGSRMGFGDSRSLKIRMINDSERADESERMELICSPTTSAPEDQKQRIKTDHDKQWLVGQYSPHDGNDSGVSDPHRPTALSNGHARMKDQPEPVDSRHRPIAMYQNQKVKFTGSGSLSPPMVYPMKQFNSARSPVDTGPVPGPGLHRTGSSRRMYPDLVEDSVDYGANSHRIRTSMAERETEDLMMTPDDFEPVESVYPAAFPAVGPTPNRFVRSASHQPSRDVRPVRDWRRPYVAVSSRRHSDFTDLIDYDDIDDDVDIHSWSVRSQSPSFMDEYITNGTVDLPARSFSIDDEDLTPTVDSLATVDDDLGGSEVSASGGVTRRSANADFYRRYAYHTSQLNRFLAEYRTLQDRLSQMQQACGRWALEGNDPNNIVHSTNINSSPAGQNQRPRLPLRPILKNRGQPKRWKSLDIEEAVQPPQRRDPPRIRYMEDDPPAEDVYYS